MPIVGNSWALGAGDDVLEDGSDDRALGHEWDEQAADCRRR